MKLTFVVLGVSQILGYTLDQRKALNGIIYNANNYYMVGINPNVKTYSANFKASTIAAKGIFDDAITNTQKRNRIDTQIGNMVYWRDQILPVKTEVSARMISALSQANFDLIRDALRDNMALPEANRQTMRQLFPPNGYRLAGTFLDSRIAGYIAAHYDNFVIMVKSLGWFYYLLQEKQLIINRVTNLRNSLPA